MWWPVVFDFRGRRVLFIFGMGSMDSGSSSRRNRCRDRGAEPHRDICQKDVFSTGNGRKIARPIPSIFFLNVARKKNGPGKSPGPRNGANGLLHHENTAHLHGVSREGADEGILAGLVEGDFDHFLLSGIE